VAIETTGLSTIIIAGVIVGIDAAISVGGTGNLRLENTGTISGGTSAVSGSAKLDYITTRGMIEGRVELRAGNDVFEGRCGAAVDLYGGDGADVLRGSHHDEGINGDSGSDKLWGYRGDDSLIGGASGYVIFGGAGEDTIGGGDGNDILNGGAGDDDVSGGGGNDILTGGSGDDTLNGNAGTDTFVFGRGHGNDLIQDFRNNIDKLDLQVFALTVSRLKNNHAKASGGGVLIDLRDLGGGTIQVNGLTLAQLDATDLIL
jgi:Ca2+-binding RTX toxin-like protein